MESMGRLQEMIKLANETAYNNYSNSSCSDFNGGVGGSSGGF